MLNLFNNTKNKYLIYCTNNHIFSIFVLSDVVVSWILRLILLMYYF